MSQQLSPPLIFNNDNTVQITELRNGLQAQQYNLSDHQFEDFICTHLAQETLPYNLVDDFPYTGPSETTSLSIIYDTDKSNQDKLVGKTMFLNNESLINTESLALKLDYVAKNGGGTSGATIPAYIGANIDTTITLDGAFTNSYNDTNLKLIFNVNNDAQYTDEIYESNQTQWQVNFSRNTNAMNYFAAINSVYEQDDEPSPFYIIEEPSNTYALGNDPTENWNSIKYFLEDKQGLSDISGSLVPYDISENNQLGYNNMGSEVVNDGYNNFDEFNTYKLVQDKPYTLSVLSSDGSNIPIRYVYPNELPVDLSSTTFNYDGVFDETTNVGSGFTIELAITENTEPYSVDTNDLLTVDNSTLINDANEPYIQLTNLSSSDHYVTENTGTLTVNSSSSGNYQYINISDTYETLDESYNSINGTIYLQSDAKWDRVYYTDGSNISGQHGTASSLTDSINVVYCGEESGDETTCINGDLLVNDSVNFYIEVKTGSTVYSNPNEFYNADTRNLAYDNSAILVIADISNNSADPEDFTLTSYLPANDLSSVYIISVQNQSLLTEESLLLNPSDLSVNGTRSTVTMSGIDLSGLPYSDFRVLLTTKKVSDVSNEIQLTNSWNLKNPDDYLIGTALKTSVIYDDYLFMTTDPSMNIAMRYDFQIANPICASTQAIKHRIQIAFNDISANLDYNTNQTIFYLDDQDITINEISMFDTSGENCTDISSNNSSYLVSDYTFQRYTRTRIFTAEFDSKFQFYENLTFVTPEITETAIFYRIYKNGIEQPSYLLRYFSCPDEGHLLSNVYVSIGENPVYTEFAYSQTACSIFQATILATTVIGSNNANDYFPLPDIDPVPIDPFFRQNCVILNITTGGHGHADINIRFDNGVQVNEPYYYVLMQNKLGANTSLTSRYFIYDATSNGSELDNYTPYNDFYNTLTQTDNLQVSDLYTTVERVGNNLIVTIKTSPTGSTLATISQPYNYLNDYNIILSPAPLIEVNITIGCNYYSYRRFAFNGSINLIDGVYYYFDVINVGSSESFNLVTDSFKLWFVDTDFPNNDPAYTTDFVKFNESNIQTWLNCLQEIPNNQTRSIWFTQLRGYSSSIYGYSGTDYVTLSRSIMSATFNFDLGSEQTATQTIDNIYYGKTVTIDNATYNGITYNLGLQLTFIHSMLLNNAYQNDINYTINVSIPTYTLTITSNPFNTELEGIVSSDALTSSSDLFYPYFHFVKPASLKSNSNYTVTVTYTVPDAVIYNKTTPSYIGNPKNVNDWSQLKTFTHNNLLNYNNYVIDSFGIWRDWENNVFYNTFESYFVLSPPIVSVYANSTDISSIPINYNPQYIGSFHINRFVNSYTNNTQPTTLTFSEYDGTKSYYSYLDVNNTQKRFRIEGNFLTIELYSGSTNGAGILYDTLLSNFSITQLTDGGLYDNDNVRVVYNGYSYDIYYKQYLIASSQNNSAENIKFNIGNAFINSPQVTYLQLPTAQGTTINLYQSNITYDVSNAAYFMIIDKYESDLTFDYNLFLTANIRELYFPVTSHYTKEILINTSAVNEDGNVISYQDLLDLISYEDISGASWLTDEGFTQTQYSGLTLTAVTEQGRLNIQNLFRYNSADNIGSKILYVHRPDVIRVVNLIGNPVYRVTNGGNVHAPRVTTTNLSLFVNPDPLPNTISQGSNNVRSIFAQNSLIREEV